MSTSTDAILAYGYDLGGPDNGWNVTEADEYGSLEIDWYDEEEGDFVGSLEARLMAVAGFTETDMDAEGFWDRQKAALESWGVEVVYHCSGEVPSYILAARSVTAVRGYPKTLDLAELSASQEGASERLGRALEALGLTPTQEAPAWLLASYWG